MPLMQSSSLNITKVTLRSLLLKSIPINIISTFKTNLKILSIVMDAVILYRCTVIVRREEKWITNYMSGLCLNVSSLLRD